MVIESWRLKSFDQLPALAVRGRSLRSAMRTVTVAWMFGIAWSSCIIGSQATTFGRLLGLTNFQFGVWSAVVSAATVGQLLIAVVVERTGLRKYNFIVFAAIHRMLWVVIAALPFILTPGKAASASFLVLIGITAFLANVATPPWYNWMGDLIPRRIRGRYLGNRALWTIPIQILTVIAAGLLVDQFTTSPVIEPMTVHNQPRLLPVISAIFAVGGILGTIDILLFLRLREIVSPPLVQSRPPPPPPAAPPPPWDWSDLRWLVWLPFRQRLCRLLWRLWLPLRRPGLAIWGVGRELAMVVADSFRVSSFGPYVGFATTIALSINISEPFFWLNALEVAHFSRLGTNLLFQVVGALSAMLMVRPWGALMDRWGRRPVLFITTVGTLISPLAWFFVIPGQLSYNYSIVALGCVLGGSMWTGLMLAQTNILMGFSQTTGRSKLIAAAAFISYIGGFVGGLAGGVITEIFKHWQQQPFYAGPFPWNNYHLTFILSILIRATALFWLVRMPESGAWRMRQVLAECRQTVGKAMRFLLGPLPDKD